MVKPIIRDVLFLSQKSEPAVEADSQAAEDLEDTLYACPERCVGLAANMIGVRKRIIIVDTGLFNMILYNPVIIRKKGPYEAEEGCMSLPGARKTTRYREIEVVYYDRSWKKQKQVFTNYIAQVIQHEMDHLEGILI